MILKRFNSMKYIEVVIDEKNDYIDYPFTYACEFDDIRVGDCVEVPFSKGNRKKRGYVLEVNDRLNKVVKGIKSIYAVRRELSLNEEMISVAKWMRDRFVCRYIEAVECFRAPKKVACKRGPFPDYDPIKERKKLNDEQKNCVDIISGAIEKKHFATFLLQGVTGSGKTEVYIRICEYCREHGKTVILLVPEISLTPQTVTRFLEVFGEESIALIHSRLTKGQRYEQWEKIRKGEAGIVIGARSAVFAPLENIGAIILDEEHESSYKSDMTPKYNTHEVAIKRAEYMGAAVVLGTATPSVFTYHNYIMGKYKRLMLTKRANNVSMPDVEIVDMSSELRDGNKTVFSRNLYDKMLSAKDNGKQIILFLNRRGYSSFVACRNCGYVVRCPECGISMTYHKEYNKMLCHYCGRASKILIKCPECESKYIKHFGIGTEQIVEAVKECMPDAVCERLDLDSVSRKGSLEKILKDFDRKKIDVLVGTQIVAKGLHFDNVGLVGIIAADLSLNVPDYRSRERTFQLITQASGRAGRGNDKGDVVIQTYSPKSFAISAAAKCDYDEFFKQEISLREKTNYPPFAELIQVIVTNEDRDKAKNTARYIFDEFLKKIGNYDRVIKVFKPKQSMLTKSNGQFRYQILIKCKKEYRDFIGKTLRNLKVHIYKNTKDGSTGIVIDVDPYSFM